MKKFLFATSLLSLCPLHAEVPSSHWPMEQLGDLALVDPVGGRNASVPDLQGKTDNKYGGSMPGFEPAVEPGVIGHALFLTRQQQGFLSIPATPAFDFTGGLTVSAWVNVSSRKRGMVVSCAEEVPAPDGGWRLFVGYGRAEFLAVNAAGEAVRISSGKDSVPTDTWTHLTGVIDSSHIRLYVNGEEMAAEPFEGPVQVSPKRIPMVIGNHATISRYRHADCPGFGGMLDEIKIWETPLSAHAVQAESEAGL